MNRLRAVRLRVPHLGLPIRTRIAVYGACVVAVTVLVFGSLVYLSIARYLRAQQDAALTQDISRPGTFFRPGITEPFQIDLKKSSDTFIEVLDGSGTPLLSSGELDGQTPPIPERTLQVAQTTGGAWATVRPPDAPPYRIYVRLAELRGIGSGYAVVGQSQLAITQQLTTLRIYLLIGILLSLVGAAAASWLVAGRALRPLESMTETAEEIGETQDLSRRLPRSPQNDEVGRLQRSFNLMLERLETAYRRLQEALAAQRRFVADASHELRTPLTTIRGNIGLLTGGREITNEDRVAAMQDIAGESERMSRMVQDLLTLARADAGQHLDKSPMQLEPIVRDIGRQAQAIQGQHEVKVEAQEDATVMGNSDALKQLLWILVDNALKHTPDGGLVELGLERQNGVATLSVRDQGDGIPSADLDRIFERFYQADPARSDEGTGLGLAIARWIASEHGGTVTASNNEDRGATFRVELPVAKS
jgi:heavy metal sensor kinase